MTAMGMTTDSIGDLMNFDQTPPRYRLSAWTIATAIMAVAFTAAAVSYTVREDRACDRQYEATLSLYRVHASRVQQLEQIGNREIEIAAQASIDAKTATGVPPSRALDEISSAVSPGIRLSNVSFDCAGRASPGDGTIPSQTGALRIAGVAASDTQLLDFVARLANSGWLHGIEVIPPSTIQGDPSGERTFELGAVFQSPTAHAMQTAKGW